MSKHAPGWSGKFEDRVVFWQSTQLGPAACEKVAAVCPSVLTNYTRANYQALRHRAWAQPPVSSVRNSEHEHGLRLLSVPWGHSGMAPGRASYQFSEDPQASRLGAASCQFSENTQAPSLGLASCMLSENTPSPSLGAASCQFGENTQAPRMGSASVSSVRTLRHLAWAKPPFSEDTHAPSLGEASFQWGHSSSIISGIRLNNPSLTSLSLGSSHIRAIILLWRILFNLGYQINCT